MSDLIDREKLYGDMLHELCGTGYRTRALRVIRSQPTVDAVEVVRCGNCANRYTKYCPLSFYGVVMPYDWFCAEGRPKEVSVTEWIG